MDQEDHYSFDGLGMSLGNLARLSRAKSRSISAEKIAESVGFESVSAFRTCFYRRVGTTPQRYRQHFAG